MKYSREALMAVFGTPRPDRTAVAKWKMKWRSTAGRIEVSNMSATIKQLEANEVDPLNYQFVYDPDGENGESVYVVFYDPQDEVLFKLQTHNT
jgi:hypothetical protein